MSHESDINLPKDEPSLLKRQLPRFLVVGASAVAVDFLSYKVLLNFLDYAPAKTLSFIAGTVVAYIFNKYWTFNRPEHKHIEVAKFVILYSSTLAANVAVNAIFLNFFPSFLLLAFLAATGTSTILNFIGQKWWVFKK